MLLCCQQTLERVPTEPAAGTWLATCSAGLTWSARSSRRRVSPARPGLRLLRAPDAARSGRASLLIGWMGLPVQPQAPTVASGWMHCLTCRAS
ncbi:hypothetical protein [Ralstonia solanacearum]|uniref:hypothetical protein n=1 Tax=Ralstonia solanacearum TaxID=305 RepID=UPI003AF33086